MSLSFTLSNQYYSILCKEQPNVESEQIRFDMHILLHGV